MSEVHYEIAIVGGGPAGISTALHLHHEAPRLAERSIVLEKARYPRDKYCAGGLGERAVAELARIGVRVDVPAVRIHGFSTRMDGQTLVAREPEMGYVVRRIEYDEALERETMARGIEVREGARALDVRASASGVEVHLAGGEVIRARAVVGADGVAGVVRKATGFSRGALRAQVLEMDTELVDGDPPGDLLHFDFDDRALNGYFWDFPTLVDGERKMCRGVYLICSDEGKRLRERMHARLESLGLRIDRYKLKFFAERGFEPRETISRPRVLLVGEAAGIDICTGEGIAQAIRYGALAGPYLARAFEARDTSFSDWRERVRASGEGQRLLVRHGVFRAFYGPARPVLERVVRAAPELLRAGAQEFAGRPKRVALATLARAMPRALPTLAMHAPELLAALRSAR